MNVTTEKALDRPAVEVRIPQVKLQLKDLGYLRSLVGNGIHCRVPDHVLSKLRFLDLIAQAKMPPDGTAIRKVEAEKKALLAKLHVAMKAENWPDVNNCGYALERLSRQLEPKVQDVLTDKGKQLLRSGEVTVRIRKAGCV